MPATELLLCFTFQDLFRDRDVDAVLKEFSAHQGAAVVVIMALYLDQQREPHRELAVYSEDILLRDQVRSSLLCWQVLWEVWCVCVCMRVNNRV